VTGAARAIETSYGGSPSVSDERVGILPRWLFPAVLTTIMVGALVLRVWGLRMGLPLILHPDEWRVVMRAMAMGTGDLDPHTTEVGALMIYVCFALFALYGGLGILVGHFDSVRDVGIAFCNDPTPFYLIARSVSVVCGMLAIYFVYRCCERLAGRWAGVAGAALLAVHPIHVERSHLAYPDAMMVCLMAAALFVLARDAHRETPTLRTDILVGLLIGLATAAKYLGAFVVPVYAVWRIGSLWRYGLGATAKHIALGGIACAVGFLIGMPTFLKYFLAAPAGISGAVTGDTAWELTRDNILRRVWKNIVTAKGLGPVGATLAGVGVVWGLRRRPALSAGLLIAIGLNVVWVTRLGRFMPRWVFPVTLVLCLFGAMGVAQLRELLPRTRLRPWLAWGGVCLLPVMIWPATERSAGYVSSIAGPDTRVLATEWIERTVPAGTAILLDGATSDVAQLRPNERSLRRMLADASGIENPRYAHIEEYYEFQIEALDRSTRPTYEIYRLSHIWFRPAVPSDSAVYDERDSISVAPGRELAVPFDEYVRRGVEYVVASQQTVDHYANDRFPIDKQFYEDLLAGTEVLEGFVPGNGVSGPEVVILRVRADHGDAEGER